MLGKLLKYDFKAVARYLLPIFGLLLISTCGTKLTLELPENNLVNVFRSVFIVAYVISLIAIGAGAMIILILHFYKNLMTDQGYLSFTLPVTPTTHLASKLINGTIWIAFTVLAIFLSVMLLLAGHIGTSEWAVIQDTFAQLIKELNRIGFSNGELLFYLIVMPLTGAVGSQITVYFCICAGQLFSGHCIIGAFVFYFGVYVVNQIVQAVLLILNSKSITTLATASDFTEMGTAMGNLITQSIVFSLLLYIVLFFASRYLLNHKLNLE